MHPPPWPWDDSTFPCKFNFCVCVWGHFWLHLIYFESSSDTYVDKALFCSHTPHCFLVSGTCRHTNASSHAQSTATRKQVHMLSLWNNFSIHIGINKTLFLDVHFFAFVCVGAVYMDVFALTATDHDSIVAKHGLETHCGEPLQQFSCLHLRGSIHT